MLLLDNALIQYLVHSLHLRLVQEQLLQIVLLAAVIPEYQFGCSSDEAVDHLPDPEHVEVRLHVFETHAMRPRCHPVYRARTFHRHGEAGSIRVREAHESQVSEYQSAIVRNEDVVRFHVPVDQLLIVESGKCIHHWPDSFQHCQCVAFELFWITGERTCLVILGHEPSFIQLVVEDADDIWMFDFLKGGNLSVHPLDSFLGAFGTVQLLHSAEVIVVVLQRIHKFEFGFKARVFKHRRKVRHGPTKSGSLFALLIPV